MIEWIQGGKSRTTTEYMSLAVYVRNEPGKSNSLTLRFSAQAAKDLRIIYGDRVVIGLDRITKQVCFKRTSDSTGTKVTYASGLKNNQPEHERVLSAAVSTNHATFKTTPITKSQIKIEGTHVAIDMPIFFDEIS